jgi:hypothetical protein
MKNLRFLVVILLMFVGTNAVWADIATRDEVEVKVELMNAARFPSFEFYIRFQGYHYDMGHKPDALVDVVMEPGKAISTGQRGARSFLYAREKNGGRQYVSKKEIGGMTAERGVDVAHYVDQIEVLSLRKGEVKFKVVARKRMGHNGEVMEILKGDVSGGGKVNWIVVLIPIICLSGLVAFFLLRRKPLAA